jgi:hypothetical protein
MQNVQTTAIPLHDIKPLLEIQDYSLYYFIAIVTVGSIILLGILYLVYRWYKMKKRFNVRAEHYKRMRNVDFRDAKKAAYELTKYGATFQNDSERHYRAYENMLEKLEKYKYKKSVENFDEDTKHYIELFEGMIDV